MAFFSVLGLCLVSLTIAWCIYSHLCLLRNYLAARKIGIPLRLLPISHGNPFWMIVDRQVVTLFRKLPLVGGDGNFTRYNWRGWEVREKCRSHLEMDPVWMHVTSGRNWLYVCEPDTLVEIFRRRTDFPRPLELFAMLDVFGDNLATVDGDQWKRHRKIARSCFNESVNAIVWSESFSQADDMMRYWASRPAGVSSSADDLRTLSLHVLSRAGFGKSFQFQGHLEKKAVAATNYKDSLQTVLENCIVIMALGTKFLANPWLPARLRRVYRAYVAFQKYLTNLYESEKQQVAESRHSTTGQSRTLMSTLIQANSAEEAEQPASLTERELYGNMFLFNFAGHDTTTHTLTFALMYLAINPQVQDWIAEETASVSDWENYAGVFPRLKRCSAVLMETIRLYTPVPVAKWTDSQPQQLSVGGKTITVPADTMVIASYAAIHTHPDYWGADALDWRPSRWIDGEEELITPRRGTFIGWSEGERSCPGKKFSQVEFVATIARLFRDRWRVEPTPRPGESAAEARRRILHQLETDSAQVLLLQMLHPERAVLSWKRTEG
ncbi:hypothetical protein PG996_000195 [Apiospora saccharicola]|uniref:Cytochrome P450 n=1 Tax=Apiospora saccharicola TaxID=335842 RepID=A0ABR1WD31_9PEZI